ncbi:tyrosinase family oxidase copper chaperone [Streptomyces capillispiralis]|uniref:Tyrosinase co-factor MelC1 n=1 Tax=Streptomyces capillispiralis TaxID=68182 RepID=A0A561TJT7_9ACTN|nr:tyrosinase family oxidase copper chaperone [Streptomyces capillispiralis]TWF87408.1 tyrosinase co-factor MelC1 [Streptomyces capillispiralis]GHH92668.1 tyrosinase [Streptomyces capillispiralis]
MVLHTGGAPDPLPPAPGGGTRREVVRALRAGVFAAGLAPALAGFRFPRSGPPPTGSAPDGTAFAQTYRGRRIRGVRRAAPGAAEDVRWHVTVDGRPLHLMRRADGTWLSMVDHYCSYPTPLEAARAAVDALPPGERLRHDAAPAHTGAGRPHEHREGRHGVRA